MAPRNAFGTDEYVLDVYKSQWIVLPQVQCRRDMETRSRRYLVAVGERMYVGKSGIECDSQQGTAAIYIEPRRLTCSVRTVTQSITDSGRVERMYGQSLRSPPCARKRRKPHPRSANCCSPLYRRFSCSWKPRTIRRWRVSPKKMLFRRCVEFCVVQYGEQRRRRGCESFMQARRPAKPLPGWEGCRCCCWLGGGLAAGQVLSQRHFRLCCGNRGKQLHAAAPIATHPDAALAAPAVLAAPRRAVYHRRPHTHAIAQHGFRVGARAPRRQRCRERV